MPGENLEKNGSFKLKLLNMEPGIRANSSNQQLVTPSEANTERRLKDLTAKEVISVFILCFVNLINYMDRYTLAGILTDVQKYFDIDDASGGLIQTVFIISYMLFAPLFGYLGDRYSRKIILAFGVTLWSLTTLAGSFMSNFYLFVMFRALVGIGEASYSTIAPTIISDLFVKDIRSKMLALFYFAIPVGSGLGYIVGSQTSYVTGQWQWALRVTPIMGAAAVILILLLLDDPERGKSEGSGHLQSTSFREDISDICRNGSFLYSTAGFTCVAFVAGALAWWGPKFIFLGIKLQTSGGDVSENSLSLIFGGITMMAGIIGLCLGCYLSQSLKKRYSRVDPIICGIGLLASAPLLVACTYLAVSNTASCLVVLFLGQVALNLNWAIVVDILLYVVLPTRRSTAEGLQLLISHALGDAGSPYLIGIVSEGLKNIMAHGSGIETDYIKYKALQYALFITCFVEVLGGIFFLITACYIKKDREKVVLAIRATSDDQEVQNINASEPETRTLIEKR
ncbi:protein spinster isoform X2 [Agrilus planipennis]|uniref:Protein spinster isoform X2 n=1 Tax=Agrilus planipennis TaxID=224129 RepID=A0A1W4WF20_AGRPL|nr:protein spinster isoform X2 [Agrilus planipennis]